MSNDFLNVKRVQIDEIDTKLVALLLKRFEITDEIGRYKLKNELPILNKSRERELLESIKAQLRNKIDTESIIEIYKEILKQSKKRQRMH